MFKSILATLLLLASSLRAIHLCSESATAEMISKKGLFWNQYHFIHLEPDSQCYMQSTDTTQIWFTTDVEVQYSVYTIQDDGSCEDYISGLRYVSEDVLFT